MTRTLILFSAIALATSCGDNNKVIDASIQDSTNPDATCSNCPAVPALGVQIDRLGRPAINTALNHAFDPSGFAGAAGVAKDAYNVDGSKGGWAASYTAQFAANLAILDVLDTGVTCTDGTCLPENSPTDSDGCGNQAGYNGALAGGGAAKATSYNTLAGILTDDELYVDTTITNSDLPTSHANYLAVELNVLSGAGNTTCGGRAPLNDVIDTTYTAVAIGVTGFRISDGSYTPFFGDNVGPHADITTAFPFLGAPH